MASTALDLHKDAAALPSRLMRLLPLALLVVGAVVLVGVLAAPKLFWDGWLYPYYWAPIVADGSDAPVGGISEGYNIVSTLTYGILLVIAVALIWQLLTRLRLRYDGAFYARVVLFVVCGSLLRVQEDSGAFGLPIGYLYIAPVIYIVIGLLTVALLVASVLTWRYGQRQRTFGLVVGLWTIAALCSAPLLAPVAFPKAFAYALPPWVYLLTALAAAVGLLWSWSKPGALHKQTLFGLSGALVMMWSLLPLLVFASAAGWPGHPPPANLTMHLLEVPNVLALAVAATIVVALAFRAIAPEHPLSSALGAPENLLLAFAHFLDAAATYRALEIFGYGEKHVLPSALISLSGTAAVMFPLKLLVILLVVYVLDIELKKELADNPTIVALIAEADTLEAAAEGEMAALAEVPAEIRAIEIEEVEEDQAIELGRLEAAAEEGDFTAPVAAFEAEPAVAIELSATEAMAEDDGGTVVLDPVVEK